MRNHVGWKQAFARGTAALLVTVVVALQARTAAGSPGDIFATAAPAIGDAAPGATSIADGDSGVATVTGAFTYSYPIVAPPGRHGMQGQVSLAYTSQGAIYGGVAAGWSLSGLPIITEDTSGGRLWSTALSVPLKRYQSSMADNRPLVVVNEPVDAGVTAYRGQNDSTFVQYQLHTGAPYHWRALSPDGTITYFGHMDARTSGCTIVSAGYAPVTRIEDAFGSTVDVYYQAGVAGECRPYAILWGHNANAGIDHFAGMLFTYASTPQLCGGIPVGSQTSYRTGTKIVTGASQLDKIETFAFPPYARPPGAGLFPPSSSWEHHRTITLTYSATTSPANCTPTTGHTPYRSLVAIQESAVGTNAPQVDLPAVEFTYGGAGVQYGEAALVSVVPWGGAGANRFNLGWGYRPDLAKWPTVEAMTIDLDGDGMIDRLQSEPVLDAATGKTTRCQARWFRNKGVGQFEDRGTIEIPTIKWASPPGTPFAGGAYAGHNGTTGTQERCALNYQRTGYRNSFTGTGYVGSCPPNNSACPNQQGQPGGPTQGWCSANTNSDCGPKTPQNDDTHFAWRWIDVNGDLRPDLVGSPVTGGIGSYDLQWGNMPTATPEPSIFGAFPSCPGTPYTADPANWANEPYTMCGGMFPWFVFLNKGTDASGRRTFGVPRAVSGTAHDTWGPLPDHIMYQPIPLETASGDASVTSRPVGQFAGMVDLDGDGFSDAVTHLPASPTQWTVFRNDGTGQLQPATAGPFLFGTSSASYLARTDYTPQTSTPLGVEGLEDLNGDGLVDHWVIGSPASDATVRPNDGLQFLTAEAYSVERSGPDAEPDPLSVVTTGDPSHYVCKGTRTDVRRTVDLDTDGRADLLTRTLTFDNRFPWFNVGGTYVAGVFSFADDGARHRIALSSDSEDACDPLGTRRWEVRSDLVDLDGDGLKEDVAFEDVNAMYVAKRLGNDPPRLLTSIKNNRGALTTIAYSSLNGAAVVQDPDTNRASPATNWVVQSVRTQDAFAGTDATTTYLYKHPRWSADGDTAVPRPHSFRGFEEVETTGPSGAKTIQRYGYDVDWSGRLTATLVIPAEAPSTVHSIDTTTWTQLTLFGGALKTYHPLVSQHYVCSNGQNEDACLETPAAFTQTTTEYKDYAPLGGGTPRLWAEHKSILQAGTSTAEGDRETHTTWELYAPDANTYRLRPSITTKQHRVSGSWVTFAKSERTWDPSYRVQLTDEVWVDNVDANRAIARSVYDMTTGNVIERWKPEQDAAGTNKTTLTYDSRKLFVASDVNELGHELEFTWDYGTGVKLTTAGPNVRSCTTGPTCPVDATHPIKETIKLQVDGLGRTRERWQTRSTDGSIYVLHLLETASYVDTVTATVPTSSSSEVLHDTDGTPRWIKQKTELDGHGRPVRAIVFSQTAAPFDQITSYQYRDDGTLASVTVPDPAQNTAATVAYTYDYDSLGRPRAIRRPDATAPADRSGVDMAYAGLVTTTQEVVGIAGGTPAVTRTTNDAFGRLVAVEEQVAALPETWATTTYAYTPDDHVAVITDPQSGVTTLAHDFAGHRTQITRGGRTWTYGYDRNGNQTSVTTPCTPAPLCEAAYTTTTAYDDLDRAQSHLPAPRDLSAADRALFGVGSEVYTWDYGPNRKGRLRYWMAYAPGSSSYTLATDLGYDAQGFPSSTAHHQVIAGYPLIVRNAFTSFSASGRLRLVRYRDQLGDANETVAEFHHDDRGQPWRVRMTAPQILVLGEQTRNVAGLVTKRRANTTGAMTFVESNWTYDKLGRVASQVVQKGPGPVQVARQELTYFGNDDPATLLHELGPSNQKTFTFGYDRRHQLTSVGETAYPNAFTASYEFGAAGRFARATQTAASLPGGDIVPRDVLYQYAGADPEQVTALVHASDGTTPFASYAYDLAGNQTIRCEGTLTGTACSGVSLHMLYDGKDQLRRITKRDASSAVLGSEEYWYDENGQRTAIVKRDAAGAKTELIRFIGDTQAHYDGTGTLTKSYAHLSLGTPVARLERTGPGQHALEFQFHGLASHTLAAVAQDGTVNASFSYTPFGEVLEATDSGAPNGAGLAAHKRRFNDKYQDDISGLGYYGFRYYDKMSMTWTQSDPLYRIAPDLAQRGSPRRANLYGFVLGNPLRYLDPDGLDAALNTPLSLEDANPDPMRVARKRSKEARDGETATTEARSLVSQLRNGTGSVLLRTAGGRRGDRTAAPNLNSPRVIELLRTLQTALSNSATFRSMFSQMMNSARGAVIVLANEGKNYTVPVPAQGTTFSPGTPSGAIMVFNPREGGPLWEGGSRGTSRIGTLQPDQYLVHELFHGFQMQTGNHRGNQWDEIRAVQFENTYRAESGQASRDCYYRCGSSSVNRTD